MITNQETFASILCPRCGGKMDKPAGSSFYWHADSNHPPCEVTNVAEVSRSASRTAQSLGDEQKNDGR